MLNEDITDYIEENPVEEISESVKDLDVAISKAEDFRSFYTGKHNELRAVMSDRYDGQFGRSYEEKMLKIKNYILYAKKNRRHIRESEMLEKKEEKETKGRSFLFLLKDGKRLVADLESTLQSSLKDVSDREVIKRKEELPQIMKNLGIISSKCSEMLQCAAYGTNDVIEIENLQKRYDKLTALKNDYFLHLQNEIGSRDLDKQDMLNEAKLNIKLSKFKGYATTIDVYTFQSEFQKLYMRTTPKNHFL